MALRDLAITDLATLKAYIKQQPLPAHTVTSLTCTPGEFPGTAVASTGALVTGHGYTTGQNVTILGADQPEYNGTYAVTVTGLNSFTYAFAGSNTSPATSVLASKITSRGEDVSTDTILSLIANGVSAWIEREVRGRVFKPRTLTELYDGAGRRSLWLQHIPVLSVAALVNDTTTVDPSAYVLDRETGRITLKETVFVCGPGTVSVTYDAGYVDGEIPDDATLLCLELSKVALDELKSGAISSAQVTSGTSTIRSRDELLPRQQRILDGLRDVRG